MREALLAGETVALRGVAIWWPHGVPRSQGGSRCTTNGVRCGTTHALRLAVDPTHAGLAYYGRKLERERLRHRARRATLSTKCRGSTSAGSRDS
jgi:hypothetical protein